MRSVSDLAGTPPGYAEFRDFCVQVLERRLRCGGENDRAAVSLRRHCVESRDRWKGELCWQRLSFIQEDHGSGNPMKLAAARGAVGEGSSCFVRRACHRSKR
jgi:hypothetical protein